MEKKEQEVSGKRSLFSSNLGFMLAAIGGAVGLGNIWAFPFKLGRGGGFPFLLIYVIFVFVLAIPMTLAEYSFGRRSRCGPVQAYRNLSKKWSFVGWINMAVCVGVMGFYCLICGWILKYLCMFALSCVGMGGEFWTMDSAEYFSMFIASPVEPLIWTALFMVINYLVVRNNIASGIEKSCKVMIPVLVAIMVIVAVRSCTLPGASEGLAYLFEPNATAFQENGGFFAILTLALLQVFFSSNIGFGTNLMYGSYMTNDSSITRSAIVVPIANTIVAILASLATIPAVFAFGYEPSSGAGMLFITLKAVFETMPGGAFFGFIFFIAVFFAALSSTIGMTAAIAAHPVDNWGWKERKASFVSSVIPVLIAIPISLGYGIWSHVRPLAFLGKETDLLDSLDFLCENCLATTAALMLCIFIGWVWKPDAVIEEVEKSGPFTWKKLFTIAIRYVCPIITLIAMLSSIGIL